MVFHMASVMELLWHALETKKVAFKFIEICHQTLRKSLKQSENNLITLCSKSPSSPWARKKERPFPFGLPFGYSPGAIAFHSIPEPETMGCECEETTFVRSSSILHSLPPFIL